MSLTYSRYLKLPQLLDLQKPLSESHEHDEMLFIVIHQVYELWFKQILHELDHLAELFRGHGRDHDSTPAIRHTLDRVLTILKTMVAQIDILETMTPMSFNSFRQRLETASGFQSPQFREVEFVLGQRDARMLRHHRKNPAAFERLEHRLRQPTLYQAFLLYLRSCGYGIPDRALEPKADGPPDPWPEIQDVLVSIYRRDERRTLICERLVDLDEGLQEWRYRHVKMVERTLGDKPGTGGSSGAAYLRGTLFHASFPDLWAIRSRL